MQFARVRLGQIPLETTIFQPMSVSLNHFNLKFPPPSQKITLTWRKKG